MLLTAAAMWLVPEAAMSARPVRRYTLSIALPPAGEGPPLPVPEGPAGRPLVVLDPGHGGHDPGALGGDGVREKDVTLTLARDVRAALLRRGRVRVALTRESDRYLLLGERPALARQVGAQLMVSIHADAAPDPSASGGVTLYTLSDVASDAVAAEMARRENRVDVVRGVNLSGVDAAASPILLDLAQRSSGAAASAFVERVRRAGEGVLPFRPDYHRSAGFAVLKAPDLPAVLIEVGYITNAADRARMTSVSGRRAFAETLAAAIELHLAATRRGSIAGT